MADAAAVRRRSAPRDRGRVRGAAHSGLTPDAVLEYARDICGLQAPRIVHLVKTAAHAEREGTAAGAAATACSWGGMNRHDARHPG
jgi:hypothetical protein